MFNCLSLSGNETCCLTMPHLQMTFAGINCKPPSSPGTSQLATLDSWTASVYKNKRDTCIYMCLYSFVQIRSLFIENSLGDDLSWQAYTLSWRQKHQPNWVFFGILQSLHSAGSLGRRGFAKGLGEYGSLAARAGFWFSVPCWVSWFPFKMRVCTKTMAMLRDHTGPILWEKRCLTWICLGVDRGEARFRRNSGQGSKTGSQQKWTYVWRIDWWMACFDAMSSNRSIPTRTYQSHWFLVWVDVWKKPATTDLWSLVRCSKIWSNGCAQYSNNA